MSDKSKIEWTDATWNPVVGCSKVSPGCDNCYAEKMACRLAAMGQQKYRNVIRCDANERGIGWSGETCCDAAALSIPLRWKTPRRIFVCSMGDLFHESVPFDFIDRVWAVMALCPQHTFQVLTKRPERMREYLTKENLGDRIFSQALEIDSQRVHRGADPGWPVTNVHLGVTAENQEQADARIPLLLQTPAAVRFVSYEPALGPVDFSPGFDAWRHVKSGALYRSEFVTPSSGPFEDVSLDGIIAGGESGPHARPAHPDWFRQVRDQCKAAGVPFFFKQWGEWAPFNRAISIPDFPDNTPICLVKKDGRMIRPYCGYDAPGHEMMRIGKKNAGRLLEGRTHDELPEATHA